MSSFQILQFQDCSGESGSLVPIEFSNLQQFLTPQRIYFLHQVPAGCTRGGHAHKIEKEIFICLSGSCIARIDADGKGKKEFSLKSPHKGIFVDTLVWHEFSNFSPDCILLAISSTAFMPGEKNYLENYREFCGIFSEKK